MQTKKRKTCRHIVEMRIKLHEWQVQDILKMLDEADKYARKRSARRRESSEHIHPEALSGILLANQKIREFVLRNSDLG